MDEQRQDNGTPATLWQRLCTIAGAAALAALLIGVPWAYSSLEARLRRAEPAPPHVVFLWPSGGATAPGDSLDQEGFGPGLTTAHPPWVSGAMRTLLARTAAGSLTGDPLDSASLERTEAALRATGWARSVDRIARRAGGVVTIEAQWRVPVAVVRTPEADHLVSALGERLPLSGRQGWSGWRFVTGPSGALPGVGQQWLGGDVAAGLRLLAHLNGRALYAQVAGVDIGAYTRDRRLAIVTDRGSRILWGSAPGDWRPGEPSDEQKIKWLEQMHASPLHGFRIDSGQDMVDLLTPRGPMFSRSVTRSDAGQPGPAPGGGD
ncbi:MAG: hypothetical protein C0475_05700 [Planctomyces sp.]|nr:hypothetical protein [Planctomyces sp.]